MHSWCRFASHSPLTFLPFCLPCSPCPFLFVPLFRTCLWLSVNPYHRARHRQGQLARLPPLRYAFTHQHPFLSILYYVPLRPTGFPSACHTHRSRRTKQQHPAPLQVAKLLFAQVCVCGETGCSNGERQKKGQQSHTTTTKNAKRIHATHGREKSKRKRKKKHDEHQHQMGTGHSFSPHPITDLPRQGQNPAESETTSTKKD